MTSITADGKYEAQAHRGGPIQMSVRGDLGSGTLKAQWCETNSATDADWFDVVDALTGNTASLTAKGMLQFDVGNGFVRLVMSDSTTPTAFGDLRPVATITQPA